MTHFEIFLILADDISVESEVEIDWPIRPSAHLLANEDHILTTVCEAETFVSALHRMRLGAIAIDTEYRFAAKSVRLRNGRHWNDVSSLIPLILSGAAWIPEDGRCIRFLFDLRNPEMLPVLVKLFRLHTVFVAHNIKAEFQTLWAMGLEPIFSQTWDTYIAARALMLGKPNQLVDIRRAAIQSDDFERVEEIDQQMASALSLIGQCSIYGITHPYSATKNALQSGFLSHPADAPFSQQQIDYALADADTTLKLYLAQQQPIIASGLHAHLHQVEFPYAEANARMEFDGVPVDLQKVAELGAGLVQAARYYRHKIMDAGIVNPNSPQQIKNWLIAKGYRKQINRNGKISTNDAVLEALEDREPLAADIRRFRRYARLSSDPLFAGELLGTDGRLHPQHRHLGAETGRNTCSTPNIIGISKTFRPIVSAPNGRAIVEADYAQIEVGIAAAEYVDVDLIEAFNEGDVYAGIARRFYWGDLSDEERNMPVGQFRASRSDLRDKIKVFVLATIYGMTDQGIADRFGISRSAANQQRTDFLSRFAGIGRAMKEMPQVGKITRFTPILGGLRRAVPRSPKAANQIDHVVAGIEYAMAAPVRCYYPCLQPRIDVNTSDTPCWNKDGQSDSIQQFVDDPSFKV